MNNMIKKLKFLFAFCVLLGVSFSICPSVLAADNTSTKTGTDSKNVLAYYDIATGEETMLTVEDAKERFGLNVDPNTLAISEEPKKPTKKITKQKLTRKETIDLKKADLKDMLFYNKQTANQASVFSLMSDNSETQAVKFSVQYSYSSNETRTMVSNVNQYPYYSIAKIYDGNNWRGTGFAVGYNLLATARHCLQSGSSWVNTVDAYFAYDNNKATYTYKASNPVGYIYYPVDTFESSTEADWAFVVWGTNTVYSTGCFGMSGDGYTGMPVKTAGYPQDLNNGNKMYECSGSITVCNDYQIETNLRAYPGQSGSPIYQQTSSGPYAIAILTGTWFPTNHSIARRIDSGLVGWLIQNGYA